jgi:putative ABC transport system permease protein
MLDLTQTLTFRYLGQRRMRALLIVLSIALGVGALVATRTLNETLGQVASSAGTPFLDRRDLVVVNGQAGLPAALAKDLEAAGIPGLRRAWPFTWGRAAVPELKGYGSLLLGVPLEPGRGKVTDAPELSITWTAGSLDVVRILASGQTPAVIGTTLANKLAAENASSRFHLRLAGHELTIAPVGTVKLEGAVAALGDDVIVMPLDDACRLIYPVRPDYVSRINLWLEPDADRDEIARRAQACVGERAEVRTSEADNDATRDLAAGLEMGVAIGGAAALVVGLFLVYNALSVSVAERRRDIGILRSSGATRGQIVRLFVSEATLLGLTGASAGLPLGLGLGWLALRLMRSSVGDAFGLSLETTSLATSAPTLLLAPAAGVATAMLAALVPAFSAALEEPADAVRRVPAAARAALVLLHVAACVLLAGSGMACVAWRDRMPPRYGAYAGMTILLLTALVATPLVSGAIGRLLQPFARRLLSLEGRLAADNLVRSPGRTGLVIAALAATGALLVMTSGFILSTEKTVLTWLDEQIAADLIVTSGGTFGNGGQMIPMSEEVGARLRARPEVEAALPVRLFGLDFRGRIVAMIVLDSGAFKDGGGERTLARNLGRYPGIREPGTVLLSENFAALYGLGVGDYVTVGGPTGPLHLKAIAVVPDYTWNRGSLIVDREWFRKEFNDDQVDVYDLWLRPGFTAEDVRNVLERENQADSLVVQTRAALRKEISATLHKVYSLAYAQQIVIGMVALLGVISALFISVLQRRRELGLLRAVGATRGQVLRSVLAEATLMGALGAAIGFGVGVLLEWYVVKILLPDDAGWVFPLHVPWQAAGLVVGSSVVLATLVGLWPALEATRMRIPEAIAYE